MKLVGLIKPNHYNFLSTDLFFTINIGALFEHLCDLHDLNVKQFLSIRRLNSLKGHLPYSGSEGLLQLQKIAQRFEEKIFVSAISQVY